MVESFARNFLSLLLVALWLLILGRVLMSWFDPGRSNQVSRFLVQATEPFLAPVRRLLPQTGMFDFSALIVLLVLGTLMRAVQAM
ncbi:MAG TPA: YggT family protein [Clostridia bacterium]|nr:YggT family protein [Clostridia bacterium]